MSGMKYFLTWLFTAVFLAGGLYVFSLKESMAPYIDIGLIAMVVFTVLSTSVYFLTYKIGQPSKKGIFIQVIMGNMIFRMLMSAIIVIIYYQTRQPDNGMFVVPFLWVYVGFTIFESYFMTEQAKN